MLDVLDRLLSADPWEQPLSGQLDGVEKWEQIRAWVDANQAMWIAAAATSGRPEEPLWDDDWAREDIAVCLHVSPAAAQRRIDHARALDGPLVAARDAMLAGHLFPIQAAALVDETQALADDVRTAVGKRVLDQAAELTPGRFRNEVRRAVIAADPAGAAERCEQAAKRRLVAHWAEPDGMSALLARLPAEHGTAVWQSLTALADSWAGDGRTLDQRRADALVALVTGQVDGSHLPRRAAVGVRIDLPTALGLADNPVTLPGYGPLPPAVGRALAEDADWQRWITDPMSGELLDVGRVRYRPSERLREFVRARDGRCRFPGCTTAARRSDLDHRIPHARGGETTRDNLVPLCRRHHRLKTHTSWRYERLRDGTVEWTDPRGRRWRDPPQRE